MCGIVGYLTNSGPLDLRAPLSAISHRGPDAEGKWETTTDELIYCGFGHRRLAIIDLDDASNQPFLSHDRRHVLVFNGEIYNFQELRGVLIDRGYEFHTSGDTEVLLYWLIEFGLEGIGELEGMFGFAYFDWENERVLLARDKLGIKPLYYYRDSDKFLFASEIRAIHAFQGVPKKIDEELIGEYLLNGFIYEPETGYRALLKVLPGTVVSICTKSMEHTSLDYWKGWEHQPPIGRFAIEQEIKRSIESHVVADVPVGLFFSGGIDSSVILTNLRRDLTTLTVRSDNDDYRKSGMSNDYYYATKIADFLHRDLEPINLNDSVKSSQSFLTAVRETARNNEELVSDFTYVSSAMLSAEAKKRGLTVMLSGLGADELFAGYPRYQLVHYRWAYKLVAPIVNLVLARVPWFSKRVDRYNAFLKEENFAFAYASLVGVFPKGEVIQMLNDTDGIDRFQKKMEKILGPVENESDLKKAMYLDRLGFLSHNFSVADKSSMQASIELRVPLATSSLAQATWDCSDSVLIGFRHRKKILRSLLLTVLPRSWVNRRKAGFNPPLDGFIRNLGQDKMRFLLLKSPLARFIRTSTILQLIDEHYGGKKNHTYRLYQLLYLSNWLSENQS